jgi:hypothetical protein
MKKVKLTFIGFNRNLVFRKAFTGSSKQVYYNTCNSAQWVVERPKDNKRREQWI